MLSCIARRSGLHDFCVFESKGESGAHWSSRRREGQRHCYQHGKARGLRDRSALHSRSGEFCYSARHGLEDFKRISLAPGASQTVDFVITPAKLLFIGLNMEEVVEAGWFDIMVGTSSVKYETVKLEVVGR